MSRNGHQHAEAFALMLYRCERCGEGERIWNSRDGVTPFVVGCRACGEDAQHVDWHRDEYRPDYEPHAGERIFRDGLQAEARAIMRARLEQGRGTPYEVPEEDWPVFIAEATLESDSGEFQRGWPMLVVVGTDAA